MKYLPVLIISFFLLQCQPRKEQPAAISLDLRSTADSLTLFGEGVISTPLYERDLAISPGGNELIYTLGDYKQNKRCLVVVKQQDGKWTKGEILNISGKYQDIEPFYSPGGNRLYFASNRPIYNDSTRQDYNIWYSDRANGSWTEPVALDSVINTRGDEFYPSLSRKGNLYFTATREDGMGREDIFMSEFIDGKFRTPVPLPEEINTPLFEFNAYIDPDEDLIIFSSFGRPDGLGGGDLYISRKNDSGKWTKSENLGPGINSDKLDYCPFIDWNSGNLYFTSERFTPGSGQIKNIDSIRELSNSPLNGFGNIYRIGLDQL
ncbi:TolB family protein [Zeaxanthinibacter enoshimensis]|uniref:WD40 repeat protein n=1 Tax=Zeaxanthinibacter enoshimensis TaxID=392009 RepID=A0A4R6TM02_9FLAO|nr:sialidase family protein [Zeaxanthinibacter enoshimensis]TDQ32205.1 WD40 repeat protein [Zeaxanthinibacter enoshimensis]